MSRPLAGATVQELLKRANGDKENVARRMAAFITTMAALCRYGIMLRYGELDSTADFNAEVVDAKLLARGVPELKNIAGSLDGSMLYRGYSRLPPQKVYPDNSHYQERHQ